MSQEFLAVVKPRRSRSLTQDLVRVLSAYIAEGQVKLGDKLPTEAEMMQRYGVSRGVVREALSRLQASGRVKTRQGIGSFVVDTPNHSSWIDPSSIVTFKEVVAVLELRMSLEVEAAGLAAIRRTSAQLIVMEQALNRFHRATQPREAALADFSFHQQIARATGNPYFCDIIDHLGSNIIPRTRLNTIQNHGDQHHYHLGLCREHEQIYTAIERGDAEVARAAMRLHLINSRERLYQLQLSSSSAFNSNALLPSISV